MTISTYLNNYTPPSVDVPRDCHAHTPVSEYDINYIFPVKVLQSDRVQLRPFIPSEHAQLLFEGLTQSPDTLKWLSIPTPTGVNDILSWHEKAFRRNPDSMLYAIFTAPTDPSAPAVPAEEYIFAGTIGLINSSVPNLTIEPGYIIILPSFQRTQVLTHTAGLVMRHILDMPDKGGLGMRRCQWTTTSLNVASQNAARRLGYTHEGVLRNMWVLPQGKEGVRAGRKGDRYEESMSRDNWYASVTWQEWEGGVREHIDKLMARR